MSSDRYLNKIQFKTALEKCLQCPQKPCAKACPVGCDPKVFIAAARKGDITAAARLIQEKNPLAHICGLICPTQFCMKACTRAKIDEPLPIPKIQATLMARAAESEKSVFGEAKISTPLLKETQTPTASLKATQTSTVFLKKTQTAGQEERTKAAFSAFSQAEQIFSKGESVRSPSFLSTAPVAVVRGDLAGLAIAPVVEGEGDSGDLSRAPVNVGEGDSDDLSRAPVAVVRGDLAGLAGAPVVEGEGDSDDLSRAPVAVVRGDLAGLAAAPVVEGEGDSDDLSRAPVAVVRGDLAGLAAAPVVEGEGDSGDLSRAPVAVVGGGPAGLAAAATLSKKGVPVHLFEADGVLGGALNFIPPHRLPSVVLEQEINALLKQAQCVIHLHTKITNPQALLSDFKAVVWAVGEQKVLFPLIPGKECLISYRDYLHTPRAYAHLKRIAVIGGGNVAFDCALTAHRNGADYVEMFVRRRLSDMRISSEDYLTLIQQQINISPLTGVTALRPAGNHLQLCVCKNRYENGVLEQIEGTQTVLPGFDGVIAAIGSQAEKINPHERIVCAGDCETGGTTAVEAIESGKKAADLILKKLEK